MRTRVSIKIIGKVQGVFFRDFTNDIAKKMRLSGFAENTKSGAVYIEVEGEEENIRKFIKKVSVGPQNAKVERVEITENVQLENTEEFQVSYGSRREG